MTESHNLAWLPDVENWADRLNDALQQDELDATWTSLVALANARMDAVRTLRLDRALRRRFGNAAPPGLTSRPVRLAVLGSSTLSHLLPAIRVGALRRNIWLTVYEAAYGQYWQEINDSSMPLHGFAPNSLLFSFDAAHLVRGADADIGGGQIVASTIAHLEQCWRLAQETFGCNIIQQTAMPRFLPLLGSNEHRLSGSQASLVSALNVQLRSATSNARVDLLAIDDRVAFDGLGTWHDPVLWHRAKQEITPAAAPLYGDLVARLVAAHQGLSRKCLVLDLDNTLWGGVIGDDGLAGIVLGQGSALGEAFLSVQSYARAMAQRGIILAVVSKNDAANATAVFEQHPEMLLKRSDIACFVANWNDKATNIRAVAKQLNIGLDSLVFVDDNPFERDFVRRELPMVAVPEVPEDPAMVPALLAHAGYFEGLQITDDDRARVSHYKANAERRELEESTADVDSYLRSLEMRLVWQRFSNVDLHRVVQLINKTNQFNLTTRRYTEPEVLEVMSDTSAFGLQFRLNDRLGDNGIIAIVIGRMVSEEDIELDTWLMSCRVLGRRVEEATLAAIVTEASRLGAKRLNGEYRPTAKNGMVQDHFPRLGFEPLKAHADGISRYVLNLADYVPSSTFITLAEATRHE